MPQLLRPTLRSGWEGSARWAAGIGQTTRLKDRRKLVSWELEGTRPEKETGRRPQPVRPLLLPGGVLEEGEHHDPYTQSCFIKGNKQNNSLYIVVRKERKVDNHEKLSGT